MYLIQNEFVGVHAKYPLAIVSFGKSEDKDIIWDKGEPKICSLHQCSRYFGLMLPIFKYHKKRYDIERDEFIKGWTIMGIRFKFWKHGINLTYSSEVPIGKQIKI